MCSRRPVKLLHVSPSDLGRMMCFFHHMRAWVLQASMTKQRYCWGRGVIVQWVGEFTAETGGGRSIGELGCCPIINPLPLSPTVQMVPAAHMAPNPVIGIRLPPSLCHCARHPPSLPSSLSALYLSNNAVLTWKIWHLPSLRIWGQWAHERWMSESSGKAGWMHRTNKTIRTIAVGLNNCANNVRQSLFTEYQYYSYGSYESDCMFS